MKLSNDRSFRAYALAFAAVLLAASLLALLASPLLSLGILAGGLISCAIWLLALRSRQKKLTQLSTELSRILQGDQALRLSDYREGELAVLQCELEKLLTELSHTNQTVTKEKLLLSESLADISHQLRTPMTTMELIVTRLRSQSLSEADRQRLTRELHSLLGRTEWLIEALLKLSRLDSGTVRLRKEQVSLDELLRRAVQPLEAAFELRDQSLQIQSIDAEFICDPQWTAEAIGNLLKNAMEHTPDGGCVSASAESTPLYVELRVHDSGPGIDPEDLPHLFERFYRGKNASAGSFGIGLSLARRILTEQDFTLKAANHPGGGAVFTMRFYHSTV